MLAINLIEQGYPCSEIICNYFYLPRDEWAVSLTYYNNLIQDNEVSFLNDIRIDAYIKLYKPIKILAEQLLITSRELNNFLAGKKMEKRAEEINKFVGRPENSFKTMVIDIAKATRQIYPTCTGKSLAEKIYFSFCYLDRFPKNGSIEQYISLSTELPRQQEKDTKLIYELVIPSQYKHLIE